jgi:hypothetical protein
MDSPLHPQEQVVPHLADVVGPELVGARICDRDRSWSAVVRHRLHASDVPRIRAPVVAPNCDAQAPRFVSSSQEECVKSVVPLGEGYDRPTLAAFVTVHHPKRNHRASVISCLTISAGSTPIPGLPSARRVAATGPREGRSFWTLRLVLMTPPRHQ